MFTGIVTAVGHIESVTPVGEDLSLEINTGALDLADVELGDSIAVNGVCLTVVKQLSQGFRADVSLESLANTNIGEFKVGTRVNLEKALTLATRLGGHLVSGHVDGVGEVLSVTRDGRSWRYQIACDKSLHKYIAAKGSITIDGTSLTVTDLIDAGFCLNIVPHTMENTIIADYKAGTKLHIEVDLMARYAERLLQFGGSQGQDKSNITESFLYENGFTGKH